MSGLANAMNHNFFNASGNEPNKPALPRQKSNPKLPSQRSISKDRPTLGFKVGKPSDRPKRKQKRRNPSLHDINVMTVKTPILKKPKAMAKKVKSKVSLFGRQASNSKMSEPGERTVKNNQATPEKIMTDPNFTLLDVSNPSDRNKDVFESPKAEERSSYSRDPSLDPSLDPYEQLEVGQRVRVRNTDHNNWKEGTVVSHHPLKVKPDHLDDAYSWNFVEAINEKTQPEAPEEVSEPSDMPPEAAPDVSEPEEGAASEQMDYNKLHEAVSEKLAEGAREEAEDPKQEGSAPPAADEWEFEDHTSSQNRYDSVEASVTPERQAIKADLLRNQTFVTTNAHAARQKEEMSALLEEKKKFEEEKRRFEAERKRLEQERMEHHARFDKIQQNIDDQKKRDGERKLQLEEEKRRREEDRQKRKQEEEEQRRQLEQKMAKVEEERKKKNEQEELERQKKLDAERERLEKLASSLQQQQQQVEEQVRQHRDSVFMVEKTSSRVGLMELRKFETIHEVVGTEMKQKESEIDALQETVNRLQQQLEAKKKSKAANGGKTNLGLGVISEEDAEEPAPAERVKLVDMFDKTPKKKKQPEPEYENTEENWKAVIEESKKIAELEDSFSDIESDSEEKKAQTPKRKNVRITAPVQKRPSRLKRQTSKVALLLANLEEQISNEFNTLGDMSGSKGPKQEKATTPRSAEDIIQSVIDPDSMPRDRRSSLRRASQAEEIIAATLNRSAKLTEPNPAATATATTETPETKKKSRPPSHQRSVSKEIPQKYSLAAQVNRKREASKYKSEKRRCLAFIVPDTMQVTLHDFIRRHSDTLRYFRITGSRMVMKCAQDVFANDNNVVFGPICNSSLLGGDAQIAAQLMLEDLGGVVVFADPLQSKTPDVASLLRLSDIYNLMVASNPTSAEMCMKVLSLGVTNPSLIPSFYSTLENPCVSEHYKNTSDKTVFE